MENGAPPSSSDCARIKSPATLFERCLPRRSPNNCGGRRRVAGIVDPGNLPSKPEFGFAEFARSSSAASAFLKSRRLRLTLSITAVLLSKGCAKIERPGNLPARVVEKFVCDSEEVANSEGIAPAASAAAVAPQQ